MTGKQTDKIIQLLESINSKLDFIDSNASWTEPVWKPVYKTLNLYYPIINKKRVGRMV
jgi:hypothetical protein